MILSISSVSEVRPSGSLDIVLHYIVLRCLRLMERPASFSEEEIKFVTFLWIWSLFSSSRSWSEPGPIARLCYSFFVSEQTRGCAGPWSNTGPLSFSLSKKKERWTCYIMSSIWKLISGKFADHQLFFLLLNPLPAASKGWTALM